MRYNFSEQYWLSTEGYYFQYRTDRNDRNIIRATLYNLKKEVVDDVRVSEGYGKPEKSQHDVINYFEARITLNLIA